MLALVLAAQSLFLSPYGSFEVRPVGAGGIPHNVNYAVVTHRFGNFLIESHSDEYPGNTWTRFVSGDTIVYGGVRYEFARTYEFWYEQPGSPYGGGLQAKDGQVYSWLEVNDLLRSYSGSVILHTCLQHAEVAVGFRLVVFDHVPGALRHKRGKHPDPTCSRE